MIVHSLLLRRERRQTARLHRLLLLSQAVWTWSRLRDEELLLRLLSGVYLHSILLHEVVLVQHVWSNLTRHLHDVVGPHVWTNHSRSLIWIHGSDLSVSTRLLELLLRFRLPLLLLHLLFFSLLPFFLQLLLDFVDLLRQQVIVFRPGVCHFVHISFDLLRVRHQVVHALVEHSRGVR